MKRITPYLSAGLAAAVFAITPLAEAQDSQPSHVMYGFDRDSGNLLRHELGTSASETVGPVQTESGQTLTNINGAAYTPDFQNIFAFWTNPDTHQGRFVYVDVHNATAVLADTTVEGGPVTGAVAVPDADDDWTVYAVQRAEIMPPQPISGTININPNNSHHMSFDLIEIDSDGHVVRHWTRDDLLNADKSDLDGQGNLIKGYASAFRIRPKGKGGQRSLQLGDETITIQNSNTYTFTSGDSQPMQVRVYNDKTTGNSMGHWYLTVEGGTAYNGDKAKVLTPRRLVTVTHKDEVEINDVTGESHDKPAGTVNELFTLNHDYDSLASLDGQNFYATAGNKLFHIDRDTGEETEIGSMSIDNVLGLEFAANTLLGFEIDHDRLAPIDPEAGQTDGTLRSIGMQNLGATVFTPYADDPNVKHDASMTAFD